MRPLSIDANERPVLTAAKAPRVRKRREPAPSGRRSTQALVLQRRVKLGLLAGAVLIAAGGVFWAWRAGLPATVEASAARAMAASGLTVQEVLLSGREHVAPAAVLAATGLQRGDPILHVDLEEVRRSVEQLGWIERATVERRLPDTIHIAIVERQPFARWQIDGKVVLIDRTGQVLERGDPRNFTHLRRVVGAGAASRAAELFAVLETEPELARRVKDAVRVRDRRWDLEFENGVTVRLPEDGAAAAWARLATLERSQKVLQRDIAGLDFRLPDRLIVRLTPEAQTARRVPGKST